MKSKLLATLVVLTLLCGMFATAIQFSGTVKAGNMYHLDVYTDPSLIPINGTQDYPEGTWVLLQALNEKIVGDTRYLFSMWDYDGLPAGSANPQYIYIDKDRNATAHYDTYYNFTVDVVGCGTPKIWTEEEPFWDAVSSKWVKKYTKAWAGVFDLIGTIEGTYGVYICPNQWQGFVNWTGDASGYNLNGPYSTWYYWIQSDPINMTGPKTAVAEWVYLYKLYVLSGSTPPLPDPPASQAGWYYEGTYVNLTAPDPHPTWISPGFARWVFDHWELDEVPQLPPNVNLTVHMDKNHTATLFYTRQSWVIRADNIGNASGFADTGKWYYDCQYYTFGPVPLWIDLGGGIRYEFRYWELDGTFFGTGMTTITLHVNSTWDGKTLRARYQTQYRVCVETNPPGVAVIPPGPCSGWYDAWSIQGPLIAPDTVPIVLGQSRWKFQQWMRSDGWVGLSPDTSTFLMMAPYNYTAYYALEYLAQWAASPVGLTFAPPWPPGSAWVKNGTNISWWAPQNDITTYVFYQWKVDSTTYDIGKNDLSPLFVTGPINGIAYYVNKTKLFMDPSYHNETAHAYCHTFNVTIWASNFDAKRLVGGQPMDIYGFDIIIDFPANLIEVQSVTTNLADFFYPNDYFPKPNGQITINNQFGFVEVIATVKYNYTGFTGTKWIFKLTFHVKYDPCYPNTEHGDIKFSYVKLVNHLDKVISPELGTFGCNYVINTVQPVLEIRNAVNYTNLVKVDKNDPQTFFDVEVYLHNGVKVKDFLVKVDFNKWQIQAVTVIIATYLKPPYTNYSWTIDNSHGYVYVGVTQDPSVPLQNCSGVLFTVRFKVVCAIWYKILGPFELKSNITISYGKLSVICACGPYDQTTTNHYLGSKNCTYIYNPLPGDLDYDGWVTVLDLQLIIDHYHWFWWGYDITGDHWTDIEDLVFVALRFNNHV